MNVNMKVISRCANAGRPGIGAMTSGLIGSIGLKEISSAIPDNIKMAFLEGAAKGALGVAAGFAMNALAATVERR